MARRPATAARRYAEAAFELATRDDAHDAWSKDLALAAQLLGDERAARIVDNPSLAFADREAVIDKLLDDRVRPQAKSLVHLLGRRGRIDLLPQISSEYDRLLRRSRGIETAVVTSAIPLTKPETEAVRDRVRKMTGAEVELESVIDPSLIGGLTVRVGDQLLDASVRGRLERLREQLVAGSR
jgi:F-type H+-transporting ATPase subunit delta